MRTTSCAFMRRRRTTLESWWYQDNDSSRDMTPAAIVQAITNLEQTGVTIAGGFWNLNAYRWPAH